MAFVRIGLKGLAVAAATMAGSVLAQGGMAGQESPPGASDQGSTSGAASSAKPSKQHEVTGQVKSVSSQALTLASGEQVRLTDQTQFKRDGQSILPTDIKPGEQVRAAYQPRNGLAYATSIEVTGSGQQGGSSQGETQQ